MTTHHPRQFPVILITGTPGTGKTTHAQMLASTSAFPFKHINVSELVTEKGFHEGLDEEWNSYTLDEDKLLDHLETIINPEDGPSETGYIIDHHSPSLFPERWIDLAVCFTCDNEVLYKRLEARGYAENKIQENTSAEILQVVLNETQESYTPEIVVTLPSSGLNEKEMQENVLRIEEWVGRWIENGAGEAQPVGRKLAEEEEEEEDEDA